MTVRRTYSQIETETTTCSHAVKFVIAICGELRQSRRRKICKTPFHDDVRRHSRQRSPAVWLTISEPFVCASMRCNKKKWNPCCAATHPIHTLVHVWDGDMTYFGWQRFGYSATLDQRVEHELLRLSLQEPEVTFEHVQSSLMRNCQVTWQNL